jgi:hypothetical protein
MTEYGASSAGGQALVAGQDVVYRLSRRYRWPTGRRFVLFAVLAVILAISRNATLEAGAYGAGALAVIFGVQYLWQGRFATRVTVRGIEVRGYLNHFVPWDEVRDIEVIRFGGGRLRDQDLVRQVYGRGSIRGSGRRARRASPGWMAHLASIKLVRANGSRLRLSAPLVSSWAPDPEFTDKARQLEQMCARYGRGAIS